MNTALTGRATQRVITRPYKPPLGEHRHVVLTQQILPQLLGALPAACDACDDAGTGLVRLGLGTIDHIEKVPHRGVWIRPETLQRSNVLRHAPEVTHDGREGVDGAVFTVITHPGIAILEH